ncbi:hypothetical protein ACQZV8_21410, partial [Magnetococcales bacterium HHB-1]
QSFGEPGHYDQALASGLPLIMAHCGGLGSEQGSSKSLTDVFLDMMQKPQYRGQFWGELSGLMLPMRVHAWPKLMQSKAVEGRLLHGSDYPLPAVRLLNPVWLLWLKGEIDGDERTALNLIYRHNPLLFDFILKRTLGAALPPMEARSWEM